MFMVIVFKWNIDNIWNREDEYVGNFANDDIYIHGHAPTISDYDNGRLQYEGKLFYDQTEYEFEIDGYSGEILEWDVEPLYCDVP